MNKLKTLKLKRYRDVDKTTHKEGYYNKINTPLGYVAYYIHERNNGKFDFEVYWTNTDTGSDTTMYIEKKQEFENLDEVHRYVLGLCEDFFADMKLRSKIEKTIEMFDDLKNEI